MEVRIESMVCLWDDKIPTMFLEFVNLDRFFLYGFGSHHFYLHQRYTSDPEMVMRNRVLSVHF